MGLRDLNINYSYRSDECSDLGTFFVSKMLEESCIYKRAVGFFSSSSLIKLSKGISHLIQKPNCHIYFVVSPYLSREDVEAINEGYQKRKIVIENALLREIKSNHDGIESERLNFMCHLIEQGVLDIKVAERVNAFEESDYGMFHEKIGLFEDESGNKVAFTGSLNESDNAFSKNFESIQVFKSWEEQNRVFIIEDDFDKLWNDETNTLAVYDFPDAVKKKLFSYRKNNFIKEIDDYELKEQIKKESTVVLPRYNCQFDLYQYQKDAINMWAKQNFVGLFDMGTGTGKTVTALTASVKLLERLKYNLATIIVCPYTHLVEQWVEEEENFGIHFLVGYSNSKYKNYLSNLNSYIQDYNDGVIKYFYFITTNASYRTPKVQEALRKIKGNVLFIGDEVHNLGSNLLKENLIDTFKYRIGLSATIDRHRDEAGTEAIYEYFGKVCIHYGLKEAIENDVLTRYFYYPIPVYLSDDEQDAYVELTKKIGKCTYMVGKKIKLTKQGEMLALKRARIVACAISKIDKLRELIEPYKNDYNLLVYCGTGKINSDDGDEDRQIDEVCKLLGNPPLNMRIARYTSRESNDLRKTIAERYKIGNDLQALVAIRCLDEGVNIPSIKTAFILASSTNPREYIQRRGRILRKFNGKKYSYLYDFVTLPFPLDDVNGYSVEYRNSFTTLIKNELERIKEFSSLAENASESDKLINNISSVFELNKFEKVENFDYIEWEDLEDE